MRQSDDLTATILISRMTCYQEITCPKCGDNHITKSGLSPLGIQRYRCQNPDCPTKTFMLNYQYKAYEPGIKERVVEMAVNSSGVRDTARALKISKGTVISTLKKGSALSAGEPAVRQGHGQAAGGAAGGGGTGRAMVVRREQGKPALYGMPLTTPPTRCWPTCSAGARTRFSRN
jgi:transposase-like protein